MLTLAALAMMAALSTDADANVANRPLPFAQQAASTDDPVRLEDIQVTGRPLASLITGFINEVAAPARRRGLARWDGQICVGVANLQREAAQYIVDRVSTVAEDVGLDVGAPGCTANVLIVAAGDADALTEALTERRRLFIVGGGGMDRGEQAFQAFRDSDAPVRWWTVSAPVDSRTGLIATRIPGQCQGSCSGVLDMVPAVEGASRVTSATVDRILRTVVVLDVDQVSAASGQQLADYVAMVVLAQIDPDADTRAYASVLNVFEAPETAQGLTQWDIAYLDGLYSAYRTSRNTRAANGEIARSIQRAHARMNSAEE